jgi:hypothetical protein
MQTSLSLREFWKVLLLRPEAFEAVRRSETGLWISLRLFVAAGLIASIGVVYGELRDLGGGSFSDHLASTAAAIDDTAAGWPGRWMPATAGALATAADRLAGAAAAIASVEPPLGPSASQALRAIGAWVSRPFAALATWLAAFLPLMLAARLIGGRGSLRQQTSLLLLGFLPQALTLLSSFALPPGTSGAGAAAVLHLVAALWSLVIVVAALAAANGFSVGQATKVLVATIAAVAIAGALAAVLVERFAGPLLSLLLP